MSAFMKFVRSLNDSRVCVLVGGCSGSGKNTFSRMMTDYREYEFSTALKEDLARSLNMSLKSLEENKDKPILSNGGIVSFTKEFILKNPQTFTDSSGECRFQGYQLDIRDYGQDGNDYQVFVGGSYTRSGQEIQLFPTYRSLINHHANCIKSFNREVWVNKTVNKIIHEDSHRVVIPGFRYEYEHEVIKKRLTDKGFKVITVRITRPGTENQNAPDNSLKDFTFDHTIENNGTLDEFNSKVRQFVELLVQ